MTITPADLRAEAYRESMAAIASAPSGRRPELDPRRGLPPETGHPGIDAAIALFRTLDTDHRAARAEMNKLEEQKRKVAEEDRSALAAAIRTGASDPGDKCSKAHAAKLTETTRRAAALRVAVNQQGDVVWGLLVANAEWLTSRLSAEHATARAAEVSALAALRASAIAAGLAKAKARWAAGLANGRSDYTVTRPKSGLTYGNGNEFTVAAILDALEATLSEV